jgi:hypothetical protein
MMLDRLQSDARRNLTWSRPNYSLNLLGFEDPALPGV